MAWSDELVIPEEVIHTEKMRKALVVVIEQLEIKNKGSGSEEVLMYVDKRSVEALVEALVELVEAEEDALVKALVDLAMGRKTDRSIIIDEVDEQTLKRVDEIVATINKMSKVWADPNNLHLKSSIPFGQPCICWPNCPHR